MIQNLIFIANLPVRFRFHVYLLLDILLIHASMNFVLILRSAAKHNSEHNTFSASCAMPSAKRHFKGTEKFKLN